MAEDEDELHEANTALAKALAREFQPDFSAFEGARLQRTSMRE